jgi:hypothetical protein
MIGSSRLALGEARYELRFNGLFNRGRGFAFPCDAQGHVDIDKLTDRSRDSYLYARSVVGVELSAPNVSPVCDPPHQHSHVMDAP